MRAVDFSCETDYRNPIRFGLQGDIELLPIFHGKLTSASGFTPHYVPESRNRVLGYDER
jgi:hypothetical protein